MTWLSLHMSVDLKVCFSGCFMIDYEKKKLLAEPIRINCRASRWMNVQASTENTLSRAQAVGSMMFGWNISTVCCLLLASDRAFGKCDA